MIIIAAGKSDLLSSHYPLSKIPPNDLEESESTYYFYDHTIFIFNENPLTWLAKIK